MMRVWRAFTLIELIVTLALVAIVVTLGAPSFHDLIRNSRLATAVGEFVTAVQLTRSEAIKRGARVTLCKSADGASCVKNGGYEQGWIVFVDPNNNATVDTGEDVIHVFQAISADMGMTLTGNTPLSMYVSYTADGVARLVSGAFQAGALTACMAPRARQIVINSVGRVRVVEATCL